MPTIRCSGRLSCHACPPPHHAILFITFSPCHVRPKTTHTPHHTHPLSCLSPATHPPPPYMPPATHAPLPCMPPTMHAPHHACFPPCMPPAMHAPHHTCPSPLWTECLLKDRGRKHYLSATSFADGKNNTYCEYVERNLNLTPKQTRSTTKSSLCRNNNTVTALTCLDSETYSMTSLMLQIKETRNENE